MDKFDSYEIRARFAPAVLVCSPVIVTSWVLFLALTQESLLAVIGSGFIAVVVVYAVSFWVRLNGRAVEADMWNRWDGPPSTRFMRWRDTTFEEGLKKRLRDAVAERAKTRLSSEEEETNDPAQADKLIAEAFQIVRATVRREEPSGVWNTHNAEYGFARNLFGSRHYWLLFSAVSVLVCAALWWNGYQSIYLVGVVINLASMTGALLMSWLLPAMAKTAADRYAESCWMSFLAGSQ